MGCCWWILDWERMGRGRRDESILTTKTGCAVNENVEDEQAGNSYKDGRQSRLCIFGKEFQTGRCMQNLGSN